MMLVRDTCEIALSKEDLKRALRLWVKHISAFNSEFRIVDYTQHPGNKYVLRMTIEPPSKVEEIRNQEDQNLVKLNAGKS